MIDVHAPLEVSMTTAVDTPLITTEQLLAMPDDEAVERELVRGRLKERGRTLRNRRHARAAANLAGLLNRWLDRQPEPRGEIHVGGAAIRLRQNPDTTIGVDVAYISAQVAQANPDDAFVIDGIPVLIAEILSP